MAALWVLIRPFLPYIIAAAAIAGLYATHKAQVWNAHRTGVNEGEAKVQAAWDADVKRRNAAAKAVAEAYGAALAESADWQKRWSEEHAKTFAPITARAAALPSAVARVRVPADAVRVLDDAVAAANGDAARPAAGAAAQAGAAPAGAETDLGALTRWGVAVADLYASCVAQVTGWQEFYARLRAAKPREEK